MLQGRRIYRETGRTARPILVWCDGDLVVFTCPVERRCVGTEHMFLAPAGMERRLCVAAQLTHADCYMVYTYMRFLDEWFILLSK
jgi:hypothetical protein